MSTFWQAQPAITVAASPGSQWYAADLHTHSTVSADARPDLGVLAANARAAGLNAVFLTDHNQASDFLISGRTANNAFFDAPTSDNLSRWTRVGSGISQVSTPIHSGTAATRIVSSGGVQYLWSVRGPNFRAGSGAVSTTFSIYPTTFDPGATFYVSASFGGDATIQRTLPGLEGYTPAATGIPKACKSVVFIWYLGAAPSSASYTPTSANCKASTIPSPTVLAFPITAGNCDIAFTLGTWNTCTLDVDAAVATLAAADRPFDYLGLTNLKVAASGTVNLVIDDYATKKALPAGSTVDSRAGAEFAARNALLAGYDDPAGNFRIFPSLEEGTGDHAQRFNFGITTAGQYTTFCGGTCNYASGVSGIAPTKASGYPAQLNHPGVSGGVTDTQATTACSNGLNPACGADVMEVRQRNMLADWDTILTTGVPLVGSWGADNHLGIWSGSSQATFLYAPSNSFDDLMQALFEGRVYDAALGTSSGHLSLVFDVGSTASEPYPARYPVYVPTGGSVTVHVSIAGIKSGSSVRWIQNGAMGANEAPTSGSAYEATRSVTLSGASAYARVEVGTSGVANPDGTTQAIILKPAAAGLPAGMSYHVERVTPPSGQHGFTAGMTRGITASTWTATSQTLSLTLRNPIGSLAEVHVASAVAPTSAIASGAAVPSAASLAAFQAATGPSWFFDGTTVYVKALADTGTDGMEIAFGGGGGDTTPPTTPGTPTGLVVGSTTATIGWTRSSDNVGVVRYDVRRDSALLGSVPQPASGDPTFDDTGLAPATTYTYVVTAVDAAGNSAASAAGSVTTQSSSGGGGTFTLKPTADAKVDASTATTNYGTSALRVDASPDVRSYLTFDASTITGTVVSVTFRIWATSSQSVGIDAYRVTDTSWTEIGLTYANQPSGSIGAAPLGASGPVVTGTWATINVIGLVTTPGTYGLVLMTTSSTALALTSRENATHPPELVIVTTGG